MEELYLKLEQDYGIVFKELTLLETAFTHTSYANEHRLLNISHNERLEFLGDAVLQLVISEWLFKKYPNKAEGELSKMRSTIVREESLAGFTRDCGFDTYVKLGKGEEKSGGRQRATILGDLFEAFLGAVFLDQGIEVAKRFLYEVMIPKVEEGNYQRVTDYKTQLQEILQAEGEIKITYHVINETGPAHDKLFEVEVQVNGDAISSGSGRSKKVAEQEAARTAIEKIATRGH